MNQQVLVGMASIPERVRSMERAVASLAPQCDRLVVSLNDYTDIPAFLAKYGNVDVLTPGNDNGGDAEKFAAVDDWDGYVVTVDDDILYPPDYVARIIQGIDDWGADKAVGFHGGTTLGWNGSAVAASHKRVRCLGTLERDDPDLNVLGTGAMGYHAASVPVWRGVFRNANMADVQMACHARTMGTRMVGLSHLVGWLTDICPPLGQGRRIYSSNRSRDGSACDTADLREEEIKRFDWLAPAPPRPHVRVSISTCGRPASLVQLLDDLARESGWAYLDVEVFEDPTGADYGLPQRMCRRRGWRWHTFESRLGRERYWQLVDRELRMARRSPAEWFLFLPDDVRLVRHALPKAIATWYRLEEPAALTLWRLKSLEGLANWTGKRPVQHPEAAEVFHVDGLYLCRRQTLASLGFRLDEPTRIPQTSSGVGRAISLKLDGLGARMYRVNESLATVNDGGVSLMNTRERVRHPAVSL